MALHLTGGCTVSGLRDGPAQSSGSLRVFPHAGRALGAKAISLRALEVTGRSPVLGGAPCDEVLYLLEGEGTLLAGGTAHALSPDTGCYLPPGARFELEGRMTLISSRCPDPEGVSEEAHSSEAPTVVRLDQCATETTGDRWYRVLLDHHIGQSRVTQFVGSIPPGRAPDHYHEYEEVLCILKGRGRMWSGEASAPIERGSCIYLPRRQVHCVENTGDGELRLLGVFHPSGSPAVRYAK